MKAPILCLSLTEGETLTSLLARVETGQENILLCGSEPPGQSELVSWVFNPAVLSEWTDAGTSLGQEADQAPVIALQRGEQRVRLRWASTWFDEPVSVATAWGTLQRADQLVQQKFRLPQANFASPVALGQHLMTACWSHDNQQVPPAPPELRALLAGIGPQGRHECLTLPEVTEIPDLWGYDMRLAYLWCCKGLPYGEVERHDWHPGRSDGQKVRATWAAPDGWDHIGLLPAWWKTPCAASFWHYPLQGEGWIDHRERTLAERNGWHLDIDQGLHWEHEGALDRWAEGLQWCLRQCSEDRTLYRLFRRVALNSIGALHRTAIRRTGALPAGGRQAPPAGNPGLRLSADGQTYFWPEEEPVRGRGLLYCHPEWSTTIWARCRARVAQAVLRVPREQVVAIRQDALFLSAPQAWGEGERVGDFRPKEHIAGPLKAPHSLAELQELRNNVVDHDH